MIFSASAFSLAANLILAAVEVSTTCQKEKHNREELSSPSKSS
jgi:hypothetical protein